MAATDDATGGSVFGGYQFARNVAISFGFTQSGQQRLSSGDTGERYDLSGIPVTAVGILPLSARLSLFGTAGLFLGTRTGWRSGCYDRDGDLFCDAWSSSDSETSLTHGAGLNFFVTRARKVGLYANWSHFDYGDSSVTGNNINVGFLSIGFVYRFGR